MAEPVISILWPVWANAWEDRPARPLTRAAAAKPTLVILKDIENAPRRMVDTHLKSPPASNRQRVTFVSDPDDFRVITYCEEVGQTGTVRSLAPLQFW
jgi:hypothetical protein